MALSLPRTFRAAYTAERSVAKPKKQRTPLLARAGRFTARILPSWDTIRTFSLSVAGLGCLTAAAWTLALWAGLAAAGISLLVLEWLTGGDS